MGVSMKNAIKFFGFIALIAVIGFSFVACGDPEQGPAGAKGDKGDTGPAGGMLPYIPVESGLLGTTWNQDEASGIITISDDGYFINNATVLSYGKRPDDVHIITCLDWGKNLNVYVITGNTLYTGYHAYDGDTYTKQE
jgi:hypothetical protein